MHVCQTTRDVGYSRREATAERYRSSAARLATVPRSQALSVT